MYRYEKKMVYFSLFLIICGNLKDVDVFFCSQFSTGSMGCCIWFNWNCRHMDLRWVSSMLYVCVCVYSIFAKFVFVFYINLPLDNTQVKLNRNEDFSQRGAACQLSNKQHKRTLVHPHSRMHARTLAYKSTLIRSVSLLFRYNVVLLFLSLSRCLYFSHSHWPIWRFIIAMKTVWCLFFFFMVWSVMVCYTCKQLSLFRVY